MSISPLNPMNSNRIEWSSQKADSQNKLQEAAEDFEALLVENMVQSMRNTLEEESEDKSEGMDGLGKEIYNDLMYQQLARAISRNARLGVAEMLKNKVNAMENARGGIKDAKEGERKGVHCCKSYSQPAVLSLSLESLGPI